MYTKQPECVNYIVIDELSPMTLRDSVQEAMEDHFEPVGGICYASNRYLQSMVRRKISETQPSNPN